MTIAFKNYIAVKGILWSQWVGLKHFETFFNSPIFLRILYNTVSISLYSLIAGFPIPILLALSLNEVRNLAFKKTVQMVTYAPYFISTAIVDGASKVQRIWHIDIPGIMPTAVILLILNVGQIMNVGFEKVFLMQNNLNMSTSDVISTYVYRMGLLNSQFSYSTAVGLFNSVVNLILL